MVLAEVLNYFAGRGRLRVAAATLVERLRQGNRLTIMRQTPIQFETAFELYRQRDDKSWSLTDCASFLIIQELQLSEILTYDVHFEQMGFRALLRS